MYHKLKNERIIGKLIYSLYYYYTKSVDDKSLNPIWKKNLESLPY